MKTNHRRKNKSSGFNYGHLTFVALIRNGCSPSYTSRKGARKAIAGRKVKDHRAARHAADRMTQKEANSYEPN